MRACGSLRALFRAGCCLESAASRIFIAGMAVRGLDRNDQDLARNESTQPFRTQASSMKNLANLRNAAGVTEWLEVLFNIVIAASFSVMSPFQATTMHTVASEGFQRNAIFRLDLLEMCLGVSFGRA